MISTNRIAPMISNEFAPTPTSYRDAPFVTNTRAFCNPPHTQLTTNNQRLTTASSYTSYILLSSRPATSAPAISTITGKGDHRHETHLSPRIAALRRQHPFGAGAAAVRAAALARPAAARPHRHGSRRRAAPPLGCRARALQWRQAGVLRCRERR